jgi:hypothetical protein
MIQTSLSRCIFMDSNYFDNPPEENGSEERYHDRIRTWKDDAAIRMAGKYQFPTKILHNEFVARKLLAVVMHHGWWLIHNIIAHPLIGIAPCRATFQFHDWTSEKLNRAPKP